MTVLTASSKNAKQIEYWNGSAGRNWVSRQDIWDIVLAPISAVLMKRAAVRPGDRVIDVGCGAGATTIDIAERVGPQGRVLGIDVSEPLLARAAERIPEGMPVQLVRADATTYAFPRRGFDLLHSRLGVMFFAEPSRAFANMRKALRPGGRVVFSCFRHAQDNPFLMKVLPAVYSLVPAPPKPAPDDPGPFSFASDERVRQVLTAGGFHSVRLERFDHDLDISGGRGLDEASAWRLRSAPPAGDCTVGRRRRNAPLPIRCAGCLRPNRKARRCPWRRHCGSWRLKVRNRPCFAGLQT